MVIELTVILKSEDSRYKQKFLVHEAFSMDLQDPVITKYVKEACANFKLDPEEIIIKTSMVL